MILFLSYLFYFFKVIVGNVFFFLIGLTQNFRIGGFFLLRRQISLFFTAIILCFDDEKLLKARIGKLSSSGGEIEVTSSEAIHSWPAGHSSYSTPAARRYRLQTSHTRGLFSALLLASSLQHFACRPLLCEPLFLDFCTTEFFWFSFSGTILCLSY